MRRYAPIEGSSGKRVPSAQEWTLGSYSEPIS